MAVAFESGISSVKGRYIDIEAYIEVSKHGDLEICQLSPGVNEAVFHQSVADGFRFVNASHSKTTEHHVYNASPGLTFALPVESVGPINFLGKVCSPDTLVCIPENAEFFVIGPENTEMYSLSLDFGLVESLTRRMLPRGAKFSYPNSTTLYSLHSSQASDLRRGLRRLKSLTEINNCIFQPITVMEQLEAHVVPRLIEALSGRPLPLSTGKFGGHQALGGLLALIHNNLDAPPSVNELADSCGVTPRTVQLLFSRHIGLSPKAYINMKRLNGSRRVLASSKGEVGRVSEAANSMGFWHMGQFSRDFKRLFGCCPSEFSELVEG